MDPLVQPSNWSSPLSPVRRPNRSYSLDFSVTTEDISEPTIWSIHRDQHTVVVHLAGPISRLETEMDGCGKAFDPPMPGEVWVIPAGRNYVSYVQGSIVRYAEIIIDPNFLENASGLTPQDQEIEPRAGDFDEFLHRSVQYLTCLVTQTDDLSQLTCQALGQTLCLHFLKKYSEHGHFRSRRTAGPELSSANVKILQDYVGSHLADHITLAKLAALANVTPNELLRLFRNSFGTTPAQYVISQRIRRARWLLSTTSKAITTIALQTGFSNHSHFTTAFKTHTGLTPREFRTSRRNRLSL